MAVIKTGLDHYILATDTEESAPAVYGEPCVLVETDTGDILFAHLAIPADDGSIRAAGVLDISIYRLTNPTTDQLEDTTIEDAGPDGFDFEQEEDYISPFNQDDEDDEDDEDDDSDALDDSDAPDDEDTPEK